MGRTYYTSDTHFGHARILELSRRPFPTVEAMDEALIARWNARVTPDDVVWHLGDFAMGHDAERIARTFWRLNGTKHLTTGNHDEGRAATLELPWASVAQIAWPVDQGTRVTVCHYPLRSWRGASKGQPHLYGHMHGKLPAYDLSLDVGVDAWDLAPVTLAEARRRMAGSPADPAFESDRHGTRERRP